jgi:hypothetical protein
MSTLNLLKEDNYEYGFNDPLRFIDSLKSRKHIVLYYENKEFGKKIQYRFIRNGLLKGENCIYTTHNDNDIASIENEMMDNDIDVKHFNKKRLLKIFNIPDLLEYPDGILKGAEAIVDKMFSNLNPNLPFRLVMRMIDKLNSREQIEANLVLEHYFHSKFEKFAGLVLCHYDIGYNPTNTNGQWVETILENHHSAIFITEKAEEGIAFDM